MESWSLSHNNMHESFTTRVLSDSTVELVQTSCQAFFRRLSLIQAACSARHHIAKSRRFCTPRNFALRAIIANAVPQPKIVAMMTAMVERCRKIWKTVMPRCIRIAVLQGNILFAFADCSIQLCLHIFGQIHPRGVPIIQVLEVSALRFNQQKAFHAKPAVLG